MQYIDSDSLCKSLRDVLRWASIPEHQDYVHRLSRHLGVTGHDLIRVGFGEPTLIHPLIALRIAAWQDPDFEIQCGKWIMEILETPTSVGESRFVSVEVNESCLPVAIREGISE